MAVRSFRWLLTLAAVSVLALVSATVYLAATADDESLFAGAIDREFEVEDDVGDGFDDDSEIDEGFDDEPYDYGDDLELDELYDDCADGDMVACDDLYLDSPGGSAYEEFGSTCGGLDDDLYGECAAELGEDGEEREEDLEVLHDACAAGDMESCDELYFDSPIGSDEEEFGSTCGGRQEETNGDCA